MTKEEKENLWKELWIRFNTSPKLYQKQDFGILMRLLKGLSDSDGGGSGEIIVNPTGEGNVVSNITADGNVLNITKSKVQSKEYFPDFAFWQKPGAKKALRYYGAQLQELLSIMVLSLDITTTGCHLCLIFGFRLEVLVALIMTVV